MRLQMINMQEFARRLSTLGAEAFTSDDVVDLATAADVRISPWGPTAVNPALSADSRIVRAPYPGAHHSLIRR